MGNLFLISTIVQALTTLGILIVLIIMLLQLREIANAILFTDSIDAGVENPDVSEPQHDYTNTGESLADILNARLTKEFGDDYKKYMNKSNSYELQNDFGMLGVEVITDEDEVKTKGE